MVHHIPYNVFFGLKSNPYDGYFWLGGKPEVTQSHVGKVGSLMKHICIVFGQEILPHVKNWQVHYLGAANCSMPINLGIAHHHEGD